MKYKWNTISLFLILLLILAIILPTSIGCWGSPSFKLIVENQSEYDLTIYINGNAIGKVSPNGQITKTGIPWDTGKYHVEAKNAQGTTIFSKTLTRAEMQRMDSRVYKVVIPLYPN